jgi:hypothetical protein
MGRGLLAGWVLVAAVVLHGVADAQTLRVMVTNDDNAFVAQRRCTATLDLPAQDLEALQKGFISVTPLNASITADGKVERFKFLQKVSLQWEGQG